MQQISLLLATVLNRWTASFAGIAVASMLVWYLGPLVPGFGSPLVRALLILAAVIVWGGVNAFMTWRRRRREGALAAGVTETDTRDADSAEEVARLRERMHAALTRLRGNRKRGMLYEQPWFVLIGPPGSGKTTALLNSGLQFPLAQEDGAVGGVGGTRLCDWWFADEAVLIDTAGRYTTQDSDAAVDRAGWHGFLDLLRRTRPRQPINGVIVVLSLTDIAAASAAERTAHARAVRRRISEISEQLRLRVPVYVVFSKADRLAGFNEYFDDLDADARAQVWGMTFPPTKGVETFVPEFQLLIERLDQRLFERLQAERAAERRALLAGFPMQVASLAQPLTEFLTQAFGGSKLDPAPFLRGIYMSSATQEGTPIDQLTGLLARTFGIDQKRAPSLRPVAGRSYFLRRLLADVVLGEALLVSSNSARSRRRHWLRASGFAAVGLATLAGGLLLWHIAASNRKALEQANVALNSYRSQLSAVALDPIADDDLPRIAPLLDQAAALPRGGGLWLTGIPGLSQREKLAQSDQLAYRDALQRILLPRLIWRLEAQMRGRFSDPDFLYEATRVYLMLGGAGPLDRNLVRNWEALDWQARFPGALNASLRDRLAHHLDALLSEPLPALTLDGALVSAARATFSRVPLDERVYSRLRADAAPGTIPDWNPAQVLGASGVPLFVRPSGKTLSEGISGFYTADGFHSILLAHLASTTQEVAGESWVLGRSEEIPSQGPAVDLLERAVVARYVADTESHWDALLGDLALASLGDRDSTIQRLYVLSSPQSPMRDLLVSITRALTPSPAAGSPPPANRLAAIVAAPAQAQETPQETAQPSAEAALAQHYAGLRVLVGDGGPTAPLAGVLRLIDALRVELSQSAPSATEGGDPVQSLLAEAQRQPAPVSRWLRQIADAGRTTLGFNAAVSAQTAFSTSDGPGALCRQVVDGHYPFERNSTHDAPLEDFARLFAPNASLDSFFASQIRPYVDMSGPVWRPRPSGGVAAPLDAASVARFQRAAAIRDAFFPTGSATPQLRFTVAPLSADAGTHATLTIGGTTVVDAGKAASAVAVTWPGADGITHASLGFDPPAGAGPAEAQGNWSLFRLLDQARITRAGDPEDFILEFRSDGHAARFALQAESSRNPFGRRLLEGFQCPRVQ